MDAYQDNNGYVRYFLTKQPFLLESTDAIKVLRKMAEDAQHYGSTSWATFFTGLVFYHEGQYAEALAQFTQVKQTSNIAPAWLCMGCCIEQFGDVAQAMNIYTQVQQMYADDPDPKKQYLAIYALLLQALALNVTGHEQEGHELYVANIERFLSNPDPDIQEKCAHILECIGLKYASFGQQEKALDVYAQLLDRYALLTGGHILRTARTYVYIIESLSDLQRYEEAIQYGAQMLERFAADTSLDVWYFYNITLNSIGVCYEKLGNEEMALSYYGKALASHSEIQHDEFHLCFLEPLLNKGWALYRLQRVREAIAVYDKALPRYKTLTTLTQQKFYAALVTNKILLLESSGQFREELHFIGEMLPKLHSTTNAVLYNAFFSAQLRKVSVLHQLKRYSEALQLVNQFLDEYEHACIERLYADKAVAMLYKAVNLEALQQKADAYRLYSELIGEFSDEKDETIEIACSHALRYRVKLICPERKDVPNNEVIGLYQQEMCAKYGSSFVESPLSLIISVALNVKSGLLPITGVRHPPDDGTAGWFIWAGEMSEDPDFFVPLHVEHLLEWCPAVLPYLGLAPGWGFVTTIDNEDVWQEDSLLLE